MVKQKNLDLSPVVCIDDARASINEVLRGEAGAGGDSAVYTTIPVSSVSIISSVYITVNVEGGRVGWYVHVPSGTAIAMPVSTNAFPLAGMTVSLALYMSYPAAKAEPRVGARPVGVSFFTWRGGRGVPVEPIVVDDVVVVVSVVSVLGLVRLARGEAGREGGS